MKKIFLFVTMLAFTAIVSAQEKKTHEIGFSTNFEQWAKAVNLTEAQKAEIIKIDAATEQKRAEIRSTGTAQDFQKLNQERDAKILNLLSAEQKAKNEAFEAKKEEAKAKKLAAEAKRK